MKDSAIGFWGFLQLIFIVMKLIPETIVYKWSWWRVLAPTWIPSIVVASFYLFLFSIYLINRKKRKQIKEKMKREEINHESKFMKKLRQAMDASKNK